MPLFLAILLFSLLIQNHSSSAGTGKKTRYSLDDGLAWRSTEDKDHCISNGKEVIVRKRIILDTGTSGMGNRMMALSSAAIMAVIMDRALTLDWKVI